MTRIALRTGGRGASSWIFQFDGTTALLGDIGGKALARYVIDRNPNRRVSGSPFQEVARGDTPAKNAPAERTEIGWCLSNVGVGLIGSSQRPTGSCSSPWQDSLGRDDQSNRSILIIEHVGLHDNRAISNVEWLGRC